MESSVIFLYDSYIILTLKVSSGLPSSQTQFEQGLFERLYLRTGKRYDRGSTCWTKVFCSIFMLVTFK